MVERGKVFVDEERERDVRKRVKLRMFRILGSPKIPSNHSDELRPGQH